LRWIGVVQSRRTQISSFIAHEQNELRPIHRELNQRVTVRTWLIRIHRPHELGWTGVAHYAQVANAVHI
jgi:hypothetical protein